MIPSTGRIIHVQRFEGIKCRAAIVGDVVWEDGKIKTIYTAVFNVHNNVNPVTNVTLTGRDHWHDPKECKDERPT